MQVARAGVVISVADHPGDGETAGYGGSVRSARRAFSDEAFAARVGEAPRAQTGHQLLEATVGGVDVGFNALQVPLFKRASGRGEGVPPAAGVRKGVVAQFVSARVDGAPAVDVGFEGASLSGEDIESGPHAPALEHWEGVVELGEDRVVEREGDGGAPVSRPALEGASGLGRARCGTSSAEWAMRPVSVSLTSSGSSTFSGRASRKRASSRAPGLLARYRGARRAAQNLTIFLDGNIPVSLY